MATLHPNSTVLIYSYVEPPAGTPPQYDPNTGRPNNLETTGTPVRLTLQELADYLATLTDSGGGGDEE